MIDEEYSTISPPYISFRTFLNLIERLAEGGIPQHIDRSYWKPFLSGSLGPHVMTTLRFFGLITSAQNEPTPELARLVEDREHRKQIFAALLRKLYAPVFNDVDLSRGTSGHLERTFTRYYKMSPDTRRKSITFFLHAAQYADLPLSAYLKDTSRARGADAKSLNRTQPTKQASAPLAHAVMASRQSRQAASDPSSMLITRSAKTVALRSGGEISLTCSVDWIGMDRADRTFVFDLIDQLKDYELVVVIDDLAGAGMDAEREEGLAEEAL